MTGTPLGRTVHEVISKERNDDDPGKRRWWMLDGGENALPLRTFLATISAPTCITRDFRKAYMTRT